MIKLSSFKNVKITYSILSISVKNLTMKVDSESSKFKNLKRLIYQITLLLVHFSNSLANYVIIGNLD